MSDKQKIEIRPIEIEFSQKGWHLQQVRRVGDIAIYRRSKDGAAKHYEVVRIKSHNGFQIPGTDERSAPAEFYPSESSWGRDGFTLHSIISANDKLQSLIQTQHKTT